MDNLDISIMSDIRDLREDWEAGYFKGRENDWHERWAIIRQKVEKWNHKEVPQKIEITEPTGLN